MAVKITSLKEAVADNGIKILVHGMAGSGKTVLGATAGETTLIISAEAGLLSISDAPDYISVAVVKTLADLTELYTMLKDVVESNPVNKDYEWIVLDSITEIAEVVLANELEKSPDPRKAYGALQTEMLKLMKGFRDLPHYHVMMVAKQTRFTDDFTGITTYVPAMPGAKLGPQIPYLFDEVFALRVEKDEEGVDYRTLQTCRDIRFEAKDRSGKLEFFEKANLKHIKNKIYGNTVASEVVEEPEEGEAADQPVFLKYWAHPESDSIGMCIEEDEWDTIISDPSSEEIGEAEYIRLSKAKA